MAYSDFSLDKVKKMFLLTEQRIALFEPEKTIEPSEWLKETLSLGLETALSSSSEKARSEFIVVPVLLEMKRKNKEAFLIFSGERLDADPEKGLNGECDFILTKGTPSSTVRSPIFSLVEAKKNDVKEGLGQCVAQMLGAGIFNRNEGNDIDSVYGCVTTGEVWQFLKIKENVIFMDSVRYYISQVPKLLGVFQAVIDSC